MEVLPERFIELDGILVDRRIFTTQFICDVVLQQCGSACCHRGCIITPAEIARIKSHDGIMQYLPEQKRDFLPGATARSFAKPGYRFQAR